MRYAAGVFLALAMGGLLAASGMAAEGLVFQRVSEPNEQAFSLLIPEGWQTEGGIIRIDPNMAGGPAQSLEAKVDFKARSDNAGTVLFHRVPDWYFCDMRFSPAGQMGLFPTGSNYQGMTVCPLLSAAQFITEVILPQNRPQAHNLQVTEERHLPEIARSYGQRLAHLAIPVNFEFDAAIVSVTYQENGVAYLEKIFTLIENRGQLAGGQWSNRETVCLRTPADTYQRWEPVFSLMIHSVRLNSKWLAGELRGAMQRAGTMIDVQQEVQKLDRQINAHRQQTNAEINNDMFLTLTSQEEYINPYTNEVEIGTDQLGQFRWETEGGDVFYSEREDFDPNDGSTLNRSDWKRSRIRPRSAR